MKTKQAWLNFTQTFFKGLFLLLPLLLSFYFLLWMIRSFDGFFQILLQPFYYDKETIPFGFGLILGVVSLYIVGLSTKSIFTQNIETWVEKMVLKIPIVGSVFSSLKEIAGYIRSIRNPDTHGNAVIITLPGMDYKIAGFLTRHNLSDLPTEDDLDDRVAVYIPLAYMVGGGFTFFVKKEHVKDLGMSFEKAMQLNLTAWMSSK